MTHSHRYLALRQDYTEQEHTANVNQPLMPERQAAELRWVAHCHNKNAA